MNATICQSCSMPLGNEESFGKNADGSKNTDYCCHCCDGDPTFSGSSTTMEEMIEICIPYELKAGAYPDAATARKALSELFPTLKRWKKQTA